MERVKREKERKRGRGGEGGRESERERERESERATSPLQIDPRDLKWSGLLSASRAEKARFHAFRLHEPDELRPRPPRDF